MTLVRRLWKEESGQGMAEYGLILALVAVVCIVAFQFLGQGVSDKVGEVNAKLGTGSGGEGE